MDGPNPSLHESISRARSAPLDAPPPPYLPEHPGFTALERLEDEITELWGHINAATYRFLKLVAEFDREEGWGRHGCANCAQWLNWQCGIGPVAAREKVRVARALEGLPLLSQSFARGELSYSKVRAITRVATPENEAALVNIALHGTASHVERLVCRYRTAERLEDAFLANEQHRERFVRYRHDEDGALIIDARLPAEVGAVVLKALEVAEEALREKPEPQALVLHCDVSAETSANRAQARSPEAAPDEPQYTAATRRADALCHLAEQYLARESAETGATDTFQVMVHVDRALFDTRAESLSPEHGAPPEPRRCELGSGITLAVETVRRLACDASLVGLLEQGGEPLSIGRKRRSIPPALKRALHARDGGCRFPGCGRARYTEGHHVRHWADGGETRLSNLVTLCRFHHRLIHEGGFGLRATDDGLFVFSRPDGSRIGATGRFRGNSPPDAQRPLPIEALNQARGLAIDKDTARSRWRREAMDYGFAVESLFALRPACSAENR